MIKILVILNCFIILYPDELFAEVNAPIDLWPELQNDQQRKVQKPDKNGTIVEVTIPRLIPFLPSKDKSNGLAILVCPGGGYGALAWKIHVEHLAKLMNEKGIAVIGLQYRINHPLNKIPHDAVADFQRALELVHKNANGWNIDPQKIIGLGCSAGANLLLQYASTTSSYKLKKGAVNLNYMALMCLWPFYKTSNDYELRHDCPNAILFTTHQDKVAPSQFTLDIAKKINAKGKKALVKEFPIGGHASFNLSPQGTAVVNWPPMLLEWLEGINLYRN